MRRWARRLSLASRATMRPLRLAAAAGALAAAPALAQEPRAVVARAVQAMGGEAALRAVAVVDGDFYSISFALGQSETPESPPRASIVFGRFVYDGAGRRRALTQELRTPAGVQHTRRITVGDIGMDETDGRQAPQTAAAVFGIQSFLSGQPQWRLLRALDHPEALTALPPRIWRGETHDGVRFSAGPDTVALYFDRRTGLLTVQEYLLDHPILGDWQNVFWYTRWQPAGPVRLPREVDVIDNGQLREQTVYSSARVNAPVDSALFVIPDSIVARAPHASPIPAAVVVQLVELAPGVWRAEGGSHHSLVVEQANQLVIVEAPQNRARTQAVLDTLRGRFPGKRVGVVVNTHYHWDHAGGLRTAMAAGIPVATHARNAAFVRRIAAARKTLEPDDLSRHPRAPTLRVLEDSLVVGEGEMLVVVYALPTVHAEGLVAAWVPSARVLFTADVLTAGATLAPLGSAELVAFARARGIAPDRYAGGHGTVAGWADVERAAAGPR